MFARLGVLLLQAVVLLLLLALGKAQLLDALVKAVAFGLVAFLLRLGGGVRGLGGIGLGKGVLPLDVVG